jgi:hypothetical protein
MPSIIKASLKLKLKPGLNFAVKTGVQVALEVREKWYSVTLPQ